MYIWKLERETGVGYDENAGFVISAETEFQAREKAAAAHAAESPELWRYVATCEPMGQAFEGVEGILLIDLNAG